MINMEAKHQISSINQIKRILSILDTKSKDERCTICGSKIYPAVLESWMGNTLIDFKIQNGFCEKCGLFQYEPEKSAKIEFQKENHRKVYKETLNSFT
jgi:hypothetical protein